MARERYPWAKMATDIHMNPRVHASGRDGREVFMYLLLLHGGRQGQWDGTIPAKSIPSLKVMGGQLQMPEEAVANGLRACSAPDIALIDVLPNGDIAILGWSDEWRSKAMTDAERAKKYRSFKAVPEKRHENVTATVTHHNDPVTPVTEGVTCLTLPSSSSSSSQSFPDAREPVRRPALPPPATAMRVAQRLAAAVGHVSGAELTRWGWELDRAMREQGATESALVVAIDWAGTQTKAGRDGFPGWKAVVTDAFALTKHLRKLVAGAASKAPDVQQGTDWGVIAKELERQGR